MADAVAATVPETDADGATPSGADDVVSEEPVADEARASGGW
ncbi:MAG: hypothetical protein ACXWBO_00245 [Ilumatobacteraceae bacterium]